MRLAPQSSIFTYFLPALLSIGSAVCGCGSHNSYPTTSGASGAGGATTSGLVCRDGAFYYNGAPFTSCSQCSSPGDCLFELDSLDHPYRATCAGEVAVCSNGNGDSPGVTTLWQDGGAVPKGLAVSGSSVYVATCPRGDILAISTEGGPPKSLAKDNCPAAIAVDEQAVYWVDFNKAHVMKVGRDGGDPIQLASMSDIPDGGAGSSFSTHARLVVDGAFIYWNFSRAGQSSIAKVSIDGGTPLTVAGGTTIGPVVVRGGLVYYWTSTNGTQGELRAVGADGGSPTTLVADVYQPWDLAADDLWLYWLTSASDWGSNNHTEIKRVMLTGSASETVTSESDSYGIGKLAVDSTGIYWMSFGKVQQLPAGDSSSKVIAEVRNGSVECTSMALDSGFVYWGDSYNYRVQKAAKAN